MKSESKRAPETVLYGSYSSSVLTSKVIKQLRYFRYIYKKSQADVNPLPSKGFPFDE